MTRQQHGHAQRATFDTDSFPIAVDGCASACMTPNKNDFIRTPQRCTTKVNGMGGDTTAILKGTVRWSIDDDNGRKHTFDIPNTYYAPTTPFRLLSPQHLAQATKDQDGTGADVNGSRCRLYWQQQQHERTIPLDTHTNVAMIRSSPSFHRYSHYAMQALAETPEEELRCLPVHIIPDDDDNEKQTELEHSATRHIEVPESIPEDTNETSLPSTPTTTTDLSQEPSQSSRETPTPTQPDIVPLELDDLPEALERLPPEPEMDNPRKEMMRWHCKLGHVPFRRLRLLALKGDLPSSLLKVPDNDTPFCAACQYGKATKRPKRLKGAENKRSIRTATAPGQVVSVDQMESSTAGLIAQLKGRPTAARYRYATIFVDHYSRLSFVHLQTTISSSETLQAKHAFERYCADNNVPKVLHYHADNGRFADNLWVQDTIQQGQTITYCGVNAHFQNGIAEKRIRDLQESARTMIVYAKHRWPKAITANLWPYALRMANDVHNATPLIQKQRAPLSLFTDTNVRCNLNHFQPFGCPVYVLDNALQASAPHPKWHDRARVGIYLGHSRTHASSISLVLNTQTGLVSPQYHVKHDRYFETVNEPVTKVIRWQIEAGFKARPKEDRPNRTPQHNKAQQESTDRTSSRPEGVAATTATYTGQDNSTPVPTETTPIEPSEPEPEPEPEEEPTPAVVTRSGRVRKETTRAKESRQQREQGIVAWWANHQDDDDEYVRHEALQEQTYRIQRDLESPIAFAASTDPDTMHIGKAMKEPDADMFREAMRKEIDAHANYEHWKVIPKTSVPKGTKILDAVWSMKRKRRLDTQEVYRHKARLTVHGGQQQQGINFWETYSPVVSWPVIRLFLVMTIMKGWHSRQIDFVLAFPQADVETDIYMKIPTGYHRNDADPRRDCLKLVKNVYGIRQGPRTFNKFLHTKLEGMGFKQSKVEPCLYTRGTTAFLVYVDDGIVIAPTEAETEQVLEDLMQAGMDVEDLGTIQDYLGVRVDHLPDGRMKLSQPKLIDSILQDLHFQTNTKPKTTPAHTTKLLDHDLDGKPFGGEFHYRRVIGKLNFLEKSTRPDLAYAVHQCARFSINPRESHANAVRHIGRYLLQSRDEGIILNPKEQSFDCFVDADFAGLWNPQTAAYDPITSKSRTGYVVTYAGCPISWQSKLQTVTALSTSEAELIALSTALREVIPLMEVIKEAKAKGFPIFADSPTVHCKAFEDNSGALEIAKEYRIRPRTKHINIRYHHFRHYVRTKQISIHAIGTEEQIADMLTKPLGEALLTTHRQKLQGW